MSLPPKLSGVERNAPYVGTGETILAGSHLIEKDESKGVDKKQPWKRVWPNTKQTGTQMQVYGFKKGEVMEILGNAGDFFAHGDWELEHDTSTPDGSHALESTAENHTAS